VADEDTRMLLEAILDYFLRLEVEQESAARRVSERYRQILIDFAIFSMHRDIAWRDMFSFETFRDFQKYTRLKKTSPAIIGLSTYLHERGTILKPLEMPNYQVQLPPIYEQYLSYLQHTKAPLKSNLGAVRRVLVPFHQHLEHHKIKLTSVKIEQLDAFLAELNKPLASRTRSSYRYHLRGFLKYLYYERRLLRADLAPLLVGPPQFAQANPPKFLRHGEVERLFASLTLDTPTEIRTYAMVHLAYTLGLRPVEISKVTLDDISFLKAEITLRTRKTNNPAILPIAETALKAVAAYVLKARPTNTYREVFLSAVKPHTPISPATVIHHIAKAMRKAGLSGTTYWLRHSYAQQLLHIGRTIYEIKEMMGHQSIQSPPKDIFTSTPR